ncbi:hypothetical protein PoB_002052700 [Plakobranchus ocellatus]|uniref:Uncharacterized protein n=1 Tax=Plakobranchus ocellatus TaxID=259542 RepID=A0AAV3ZFD5_9GAST|nr:hypothetical protein PoB_002052700 [Plakobranchus ocellatus]
MFYQIVLTICVLYNISKTRQLLTQQRAAVISLEVPDDVSAVESVPFMRGREVFSAAPSATIALRERLRLTERATKAEKVRGLLDLER